ncbi:DnaJ domain-containing protein [Favolaschia claudopus]|uniref:Diphthamide biosynthesis protein 4 n=1 Tax=Favolaschia claudopus TaxID=2862362 RepID=A0AAW0DWV6_9AGAR
MNPYSLLNVDSGASSADIKTAYHRALLTAHPDKNPQSSQTDVAAIKEAYRILSTPSLRAKSDQEHSKRKGPRPAQVISLTEFDEVEGDDSWVHSCRCGGIYIITGAEMERGLHLVPCTSCSETVWIGYELVEEDS